MLKISFNLFHSMKKNSFVYDSIDDIIGFLNEGGRNNKELEQTSKEQEFQKSINEKSLLEEQYDTLSEFQANYEEEYKKKGEKNQVIQNNSIENLQRSIQNESFFNLALNKYFFKRKNYGIYKLFQNLVQ